MQPTSYSRWLRAQRAVAGLTQVQLAEALGVAERTIWAWETGRRLPRPAQIRALARVLGRDPEEVAEVVAAAQRDRLVAGLRDG